MFTFIFIFTGNCVGINWRIHLDLYVLYFNFVVSIIVVVRLRSEDITFAYTPVNWTAVPELYGV